MVTLFPTVPSVIPSMSTLEIASPWLGQLLKDTFLSLLSLVLAFLNGTRSMAPVTLRSRPPLWCPPVVVPLVPEVVVWCRLGARLCPGPTRPRLPTVSF